MAKSSKYITLPAAAKNPIKKKSTMGVIGVFIALALLLTIDKFANMFGQKANEDPAKVKTWAHKLASVGSGILFLMLAVAFAAVPGLNLAFLAAGALAIGLPFREYLGF